MALSLAVLLLPVVLLLGFDRLVLDGDEPIAVDPAPAVAEARAATAFPVSEPGDVPAGWHLTSARFQRTAAGATLRLGYAGPRQSSLQLVQSSVPADQLLPAELGEGPTPDGTLQVGARPWQRYDTKRAEQALVLLEPGRTMILVGTAQPDELQAMAATLP